jgi:hypothetical protein
LRVLQGLGDVAQERRPSLDARAQRLGRRRGQVSSIIAGIAGERCPMITTRWAFLGYLTLWIGVSLAVFSLLALVTTR